MKLKYKLNEIILIYDRYSVFYYCLRATYTWILIQN